MRRGELKRRILQEPRFEEAQGKFQQALSLHPDCTIACSNLGRTLFVLGRGREARAEIVSLGEKAESMAAYPRAASERRRSPPVE